LVTINGSTNAPVWSFKLEVDENSTSIANNSSRVTVTAYIGRPASAGASYLYGANISCPVSVTGAGTKTITYNNANQVNVSAGGWLSIGSVVFDSVPHDANGSKTVTVSANFTNNISPSSGSASDSVKLTNIARASTFTIDKTTINANGKDKITVAINAKNTAYKHTVTVAFGSSYSQTFSVPAGTTTQAFTIPYEWLNGIPAQLSSNSTNIILTTYNGTTLVGTASLPKCFTITCPADVVPVISSVTVTGNALRDGVYVQGKSTATIETVAGGVYGSKIVSYSCVVDGVKYTGSKFTTSAFKSAGAYTITVTVTDGRGRSASKSATAFTVYEYKQPYITSFTAERQADGTTVVATLVGGVSSLNGKNGKVFSVSLNGKTQAITSSGYTANGSTTFTGVDTDSTFVATARVADYYTEVTMPVVVQTEAVTMDFHHSGKGVAFGKVSEEENLLDCAWDIKSHGTISSLEYSKLIGFKYLGTVNLNDIKTPGMYGVYNATNGPATNGIATLEVITYSPDWIVQRFTVVANGLIYVRRWHSGTTWSGWYTILDTSQVKDYVIDHGTYDGWEYTKWNSGKIEWWTDMSLTFPAPTYKSDYLWRTIVSIDMGDKVTKIISGHCPVQYNGITPHLSRHMEYPYIAEVVIATSKNFEAFTTTIPIYIIGKWK
jgi:hypothetical protein